MSSGVFVTSKYEATAIPFIMPVRIQPETLLLQVGTTANNPPTGAVTLPIFAKVTKGKKSYGVGPRAITIRWSAAPPAGFAANQSITVPILTTALYTAATPGATGTYLGAAFVVSSRIAESAK